jgi:hypothetical protein
MPLSPPKLDPKEEHFRIASDIDAEYASSGRVEDRALRPRRLFPVGPVDRPSLRWPLLAR